jgi:lipopolysaccharide heptosyltransferase II
MRLSRIVVLAPNWLGDLVMALPAISSLRAWHPDAHLAVAARRGIAPLLSLVDGVDDIVQFEGAGGWISAVTSSADVERLAQGKYDAAVLFPNSFAAALLARRARIPGRWGYSRDFRARLLTQAVAPPKAPLHHAEYYLTLVTALGAPASPPVASLRVEQALRDRAAALLTDEGWHGEPIVSFAPGAAFGPAKRWPTDRVAAVAAVVGARGAVAVLVGARADARTARCVHSEYTKATRGGSASPMIDLTGRTDLPLLAGVLALSTTMVSNDSGSMHVAAAVGTPVVAMFGPTNERRTSPLAHQQGSPRAIIAGDAWCRPCELRRCPLDHRCMKSISVERVVAETIRLQQSAGREEGGRS